MRNYSNIFIYMFITRLLLTLISLSSLLSIIIYKVINGYTLTKVSLLIMLIKELIFV